MDITPLKKLGLPEKYAHVYLTLVRQGPLSVRKLSEEAGLNRGTTYDALKWLQDEQLVTYYHHKKKQTFVAEPPESLRSLAAARATELERTTNQIEKLIPELTALYDAGGERPVAEYLTAEGIPALLEDVLTYTAEAEDPTYRIYSPAALREFLYEQFPSFSDRRVAKGVAVKAIAIGDGGELRGLDERRFLSVDITEPAYKLIYPGHVATITQNVAGEAVGVVVRHGGVFATECAIFDTLWNSLR